LGTAAIAARETSASAREISSAGCPLPGETSTASAAATAPASTAALRQSVRTLSDKEQASEQSGDNPFVERMLGDHL
jgi:hypothetical protein